MEFINQLDEKIFLSPILTQAEKVKAYFQRGARPFVGTTEYPSPLVGYGVLCVEASIPKV